MPHDFMEKIKKVFFNVWSSIAFAAPFLAFFYGTFNLLYKIGILSKSLVFPISALISLIVGILLTVLITKSDIALFWIGKNGITIAIALVILGTFLISFQTDEIIQKNQLKELITVEWMIFAISITIFALLITRFKGLVDSVKTKEDKQKNINEYSR